MNGSDALEQAAKWETHFLLTRHHHRFGTPQVLPDWGADNADKREMLRFAAARCQPNVTPVLVSESSLTADLTAWTGLCAAIMSVLSTHATDLLPYARPEGPDPCQM